MGGADLGLGVLISMRDAFSQQAGTVENSMRSLDATIANSTERINHSMNQIQQGAVLMGAGLALAAIPTALVASTTASQAALAGLKSEGVQNLTAIEDAATEFSNKFSGMYKDEILSGCYEIKGALANLSDEAVGSFAQNVALTASATKSSFAEMTAAFTTGYGIFKPMMSDLSDMEWSRQFSGAMAQTVAAFKTNGVQMADAIKNIGAMAAASKIPLEEQLAVLGQLQTTMPGAEAGTLYKAFIQKVAIAGKELGLSLVGADGRVKGVVDVIGELKKKFPDLSQAAAQVQLQKAFGTDEAVKFILQMDQGMDSLKGNIDGVRAAMLGGTAATEKMAAAMTSDIGSEMKLVGQESKNLAETLGKTLIPIAIPFLKSIQGVVVGMQEWAKENPNLARGILVFTLSLGGLLFVAGAVVSVLGIIGLLSATVPAGLAAMGPILAGIGSTVMTTMLPVIAIIGGIVLAVWLLKRAWDTNFAGMRDTLTTAWNNIKLVFTGISELITSLSGGAGKMSAETANALQRAGLLDFVITVFMVYYRVREFLTGLWEAFSESFAAIRAVVEPAVKVMIGAFSALATTFTQVFGGFGAANESVMGASSNYRILGSVIGYLVGGLAKLVAYILTAVVYAFVGIVYAINGVVRAVNWCSHKFVEFKGIFKGVAIALGIAFGPALATQVGTTLGHVARFMISTGRAAVHMAQDFLYGVARMAAAGWAGILSGLGSLWTTLRTAAIAVWQFNAALWANPIVWIVAAVIALIAVAYLLWKNWDKVSAWLTGAWAWMKTAAINAFNGVTNFLRQWGPAILAVIFPVLGVPLLIWQHWGKIKPMIVNALTGVLTFMGQLPAKALEMGRGLMQALAKGITGAAMAPVNALKAGFNKLKKLLPHSDAEEGPLSQLTMNGYRMLETFSHGMQQAVSLPLNAFADSVNMTPIIQRVIPATSPTQAGAVPTAASRLNRSMAAAGAGGGQTDIRDLLVTMIEHIDALAKRPIEANVITKLDGKQVSKSVYRNAAEDKSRQYE